MSMGIVPLAVILVIMAAALVFHHLYINKIYRKVKGYQATAASRRESY